MTIPDRLETPTGLSALWTAVIAELRTRATPAPLRWTRNGLRWLNYWRPVLGIGKKPSRAPTLSRCKKRTPVGTHEPATTRFQVFWSREDMGGR